MPPCNCAQATCQCVLQSTETVAVSGAGSAASPYELDTIGLASTLHSTAVPVGNVGPGIDTLANVNVPANTLNATGDRLRFRAMITLAAVVENNGFTFSYGGTPFFAFPLVAPVVESVIVCGEIIRTGVLTQVAIVDETGTSIFAVLRTDLAEDNTVANAFLVTGESGGAGETNAVVLESLTIDVLPL